MFRIQRWGQSGNTAVALDTIINPKSTGMKCIYVVIGQHRARGRTGASRRRHMNSAVFILNNREQTSVALSISSAWHSGATISTAVNGEIPPCLPRPIGRHTPADIPMWRRWPPCLGRGDADRDAHGIFVCGGPGGNRAHLYGQSSGRKIEGEKPSTVKLLLTATPRPVQPSGKLKGPRVPLTDCW